jgi:RNA 2',3'-cyclic 3'-phosphodiesterase
MARGATARLFVAVDPPPEVRARLAAWARELALATRASWPLRVLAPDSLHLTLCFLGSRPVGEIAALAAALEPAAAPLGELRVGAPLLLPPRRPRALAVEIHDDDGGLAALHARLLAQLTRVSDWQPERRRLRPHVTLARMRGGVARGVDVARGGGPPVLSAPTPGLAFTPRALILYRSRLDPAGASYEALAECELALFD